MKQLYYLALGTALCSRCGLPHRIIDLDSLLRCAGCRVQTGRSEVV